MSGSNYDKFPSVEVPGFASQCWRGWERVCAQMNRAVREAGRDRKRMVVAVECYPGLHEQELVENLRGALPTELFVHAREVLKSSEQIDQLVAPWLGGNDPIFGFYCPLNLQAFMDADKVAAVRQRIDRARGLVVVFGVGASLCCQADLLIYADMPRWEGQLRQRRDEVSNLGADNTTEKASLQYKRSFFVDWRVCDRLKQATMSKWDYLLDTTTRNDPKLITGEALRAGLDTAVGRPFRVVPFFDPAPWGGQWIKDVVDLDRNAANFGWGFDCVPEENSLLLRFGETLVEIPSQNLVYHHPRPLLGDAIYGLFGPEFPIRFDFLDTMGGGNLSLQVHPIVQYAREQFGLQYTQDESYYLLDAGENATVFLGLKTGADAAELFTALDAAQSGNDPFPEDRYVNAWPAKKHDHFLIPSGTIHCSGANTMVLEISATPYIFTFKLWDWSRMGLDGLPRPINIRHGRAVLQADRQTQWVKENLVNRFEPLGQGEGWREERTGLHSLEFIETRRHWFTGTVPHDTDGTVNVLNLVEGREATVESPHGAFAPFVVHYAETFIVPAAVGAYTVRPSGESIGKQCATMKAFVRCKAT